MPEPTRKTARIRYVRHPWRYYLVAHLHAVHRAPLHRHQVAHRLPQTRARARAQHQHQPGVTEAAAIGFGCPLLSSCRWHERRAGPAHRDCHVKLLLRVARPAQRQRATSLAQLVLQILAEALHTKRRGDSHAGQTVAIGQHSSHAEPVCVHCTVYEWENPSSWVGPLSGSCYCERWPIRAVHH